MTACAPAPIVVRLFEPITLLFPKANDMPLLATVPSPVCIICSGPASPPSRMGWLSTPDRQAVFVCCGACSDCADAELEAKIVGKVESQTVGGSNRGVTQEAAIRKPDASEFLPLPYYPWISRPDTCPLDVEEAATALFLKNGDVGAAANRLCVTSVS